MTVITVRMYDSTEYEKAAYFKVGTLYRTALNEFIRILKTENFAYFTNFTTQTYEFSN